MDASYEKSLKELDELKSAMTTMDIKIEEKEQDNCEISQQIEELEKVLRKSITEADLMQEDDAALQALEEEERKLQHELDLITATRDQLLDDQKRLNGNGGYETPPSGNSDDDDTIEGEELSTEFKRELERTMSTDDAWSYPTA